MAQGQHREMPWTHLSLVSLQGVSRLSSVIVVTASHQPPGALATTCYMLFKISPRFGGVDGGPLDAILDVSRCDLKVWQAELRGCQFFIKGRGYLAKSETHRAHDWNIRCGFVCDEISDRLERYKSSLFLSKHLG